MDLLNILWMIVIFFISLAVILIIPRVRELENRNMKTLAYIGLGLVAFLMVGFAFKAGELPQPTDILYASNIVNPYLQFYPTLILAMAITATVLVMYMEGDNYAYFFAGAGFAALLPNIFTYVLSNGRSELALLGCALWAIIPVIWAFLWKDGAYSKTTMLEKATTSVKAALLSYPVYLLTAIVAVFGESPRGLNINLVNGITSSMMNIVGFIIYTLWMYLLVTIIIVTAMFFIHDLVLQLLGMRRVASRNGIRYEKIPVIKAEAPKPKVDHFAGLIGEMQVFSRNIERIDRIRAASTIGRFKNEYLTLSAKYDDESKADAERLIKAIEHDFMKLY